MHPTLTKFQELIDSMPECYEQIILETMLGNMLCGKSSKALAELASSIAAENLKELESTHKQ